MEIFEDGYLKSEFINPNYRGLVGWPLKIDYELEKLILVNQTPEGLSAYKVDTDGYETLFTLDDHTKIQKFTAEQIPVGELCWFYNSSWNIWILVPFEHYGVNGLDLAMGKTGDDMFYSSSTVCGHRLCVPYLIAETAEDAEKLKGWNK